MDEDYEFNPKGNFWTSITASTAMSIFSVGCEQVQTLDVQTAIDPKTTVASVSPIVGAPGTVVSVTGSGLVQNLPLIARFVLADGRIAEVPMQFVNSTEATLAVPSGLKIGIASFEVLQDGKSLGVLRFVAYDGPNDLPILITEPSSVCSDFAYIDHSGTKTFGTRACDTVHSAPCSADGQTDCMANDEFAAATTDNLAEKVLVGQVVAGVQGAATGASNIPICRADGATSCVAHVDFPAAQKNGLSAKVLYGQTVAGVSGTVPLTHAVADCTQEGQVACKTTFTLRPVDVNTIAERVVIGQSIAGVAGTQSIRPSDCGSDGEMNCVANASYPALHLANAASYNIKSGITMAGVTGTLVGGTVNLTVSRGPAPPNTTIPGPAARTAQHGSTVTYLVVPKSGYFIDSSRPVTGTCATGSWRENTYTTGNITSSCTVSFDNELAVEGVGSHSIPVSLIASADHKTTWVAKGVGNNETRTLVVTPPLAEAPLINGSAPSYSVSQSVSGSCNPGYWSGSQYTTGILEENCTVIFTLSSPCTIGSVNVAGNWGDVASIMTSDLRFDVTNDNQFRNGCAASGCHGLAQSTSKFFVGFVGEGTGKDLRYEDLSQLTKLTMHHFVTNGYSISGSPSNQFAYVAGTPAFITPHNVLDPLSSRFSPETTCSTTATGIPCLYANSTKIVRPYDPLNSRLFRKVLATGATSGNRMPNGIGTSTYSARALTQTEQSKMCNWIWNGAKYD